MTTTIGALCARYLEAYPKVSGTKRAVLTRLQGEPIGKVKAPGRASHYINHCECRRADAAPHAVMLDIIFLRRVLAEAKPSWDLADVTDAPIREAWPILRSRGLIGRAPRRTTVPSDEQTAALVAYLRPRNALYADIVEFQDESSRRISETERAEWGQYDPATKTLLVLKMKHPKHKRDKRVALPDRAVEIIERQPRLTTDPHERIFKFRQKTFQAAYHRAVQKCGFTGLRLHDHRRKTVTRMLAAGEPPQRIMLVTGHDRPDMVWTTYNGMKAEDFHRPRP